MNQEMKDVMVLGVMMFGTYFTGYYVGRIFGFNDAYKRFKKMRRKWQEILKEKGLIVKEYRKMINNRTKGTS